jgi:putative transcriptional regulator
MENTLFADLVQSLKEASAIAKGEAPASRRFETAQTDVKTVRERIGLSQAELRHSRHRYDEADFQ